MATNTIAISVGPITQGEEIFEEPVAIEPISASGQESDEGSKFTCFPKLPLEVRRKIWKNVCSVTRVIDLWGRFPFETFDGHHGPNAPILYESYARKAPAILHASRESRAIGLEQYSLSFGYNIREFDGQASLLVSIPAEIYVNWECDIICPVTTLYGDRYQFETRLYHFLQNGDLASGSQMQRIALSVEQANHNWATALMSFGYQLHEILLYDHPNGFVYDSKIRYRLQFEDFGSQLEEGRFAVEQAARLE
ncbi:hypothetical protein N431DRAFT_455068 [Stipitochalara longipes BDJ]|nr:hypothetical protein N431DRAFT_455068 [Stipitochalara longipes BDJ]